MKTSSKVFARMLDAALLAGLVLGSADVRVFAFWMVSIMVVLMFMGWLAMTPDLAEKIQGRSIIKKAFGILMHTLYVVALIYVGFPILAAMYASAPMGGGRVRTTPACTKRTTRPPDSIESISRSAAT